jgi:phosphotransferase system IIA component
LAEVLHSDEKVEAGDLLSIADGEKIQKSNMAYDTKVIGIASTAPAIFLQNGKMEISAGNKLFSEGTEVPLALKGRTLCKVTSEGGPIKPGDLLTSSSLPGHAMKATDAQKSDHSIIGKALESFNPQDGTNSTGKIVILVTLQ